LFPQISINNKAQPRNPVYFL